MEFSDLEMKSLFPEPENGDGGKLYRAVHRLTGEVFIAKEVFFDGRDSVDRPVFEMAKQFDDPYILKCREAFVMDDRVYLLFEHVDVVGESPSFTSEPEVVSVVRQVLLGLKYLHGNARSHGDVNSSNILVDSEGRVKVLYSGKDKLKGDVNVGDRVLNLGEIELKGDVNVGEICDENVGEMWDEFSWDVWCVGLYILKLFRRSLMVPSTKMWRFILCCMQINPTRWTVKELLGHPCLRQPRVVPSKRRKRLSASTSMTSKSAISYETEQPAHVLRERSKKIFLSSRKKPKVSLGVEQGVKGAESSKDHPVPVDDPSNYVGFTSPTYEPMLSDETEQQRASIKKSNVSLGLELGINEVESSKDPLQIEIVPDVLVRCRQHCTMFLPDCEFEKDKCIQLWIAEEFIGFEETRIMEDVANFYFDELVREEFIIPSKFDHLYREMRYKVNTSKVPTSFLEQGEYIRICEGGLDQISGEALHLVWHCKRLDKTSVDALKKLNHLRTLLVHADCSALTRRLPNDTFVGLYRLRTLDLSCTHLLELPGSIRLLEALRYLDISETPIKRLPESIDCLYYLQTLKLRGCSGLSTLPKGLERLINLRHLALNIVGQLEFMPTGMGNLVKLQTLQAFIVGKKDGCGIRELKNMNDITGSFCISKLENVSSADEAKEAALWNKKRIDKLELRWQDYGNEKSQDTSAILECLQPQFHLRELQIIHYSGLKLPRWISNPSYTDLSSIKLYKCINCDILPTIGKLPSLKNLHIVEMNNLRNINTLFSRDDGIQELSVSLKLENAFPQLEKLTLENMLNLEEWTGIEDGDFPCLSHISIRHCPKLSTLPSLSCLCSLRCLELNQCTQLLSLPEGLLPATLESLIVKGCPIINERCLNEGQDYFKIVDLKNVYIDFEKISLD